MNEGAGISCVRSMRGWISAVFLYSPQGLPLMHEGHIRVHHTWPHSRSTNPYTRHNGGQ